ncbi:MAG: helix-turn-helix transcriptional regulator [Acidimicrobiales bacterium]
MTVWQSPGDVLRWWRSGVLGLTQQQAAERLCVESSTVSNWERNTRTSSLDLATLDTALAGDGVLADLMWGYGTAEGIDPGQVWTKVFPGASTPVWMWVRTTSPSVSIEAEWGVFRIEKQLDVCENGIFVTVGASVPDSPVVVYLSEPGWVDFGHGQLPDVVPGAVVISAVSDFTASSADGAFMELFRNTIESELAAGLDGVVNDAIEVPESLSSFIAKGRDRSGLARWPPRPEGIDAVERANFARLRSARHLSLPQLADRLARQTNIEVGRDTLRRFESNVGEPHDRMLPIALDHVLGADGRLAAVEVKSGHGSAAAVFPPYWRGPIWLALEPAEPDTSLVLGRGRWRRELRVEGSALASIHWFDPSVPLRIESLPSLSWSVGLGRRAGAEAIDQNWVPGSVDIAQQAVAEAQHAFEQALGVESSDREPPT